MIKTLIKSAFSALGYELRKKNERGFCPPYLARILDPKTVIDVGVASGTYELYEAYPKARFILVEPLKEFKEALAKISAAYDCRVYNKALGSRSGKMEINVNPGNLVLSSLNARPSNTDQLEKRLIEVTTLDAIYKENTDIAKPILLKIDTEGNELEVLRGAKETLPHIDMVILEVSIAKRFENTHGFADIVHFMNENGFAVFDFLTICYNREKAGANLADVLFKRVTA